MKNTTRSRRQVRKKRIRAKIWGTKARPRISIFRSNKALYVQFVDDDRRVTLWGQRDSTTAATQKSKVGRAREFGTILAREAKEKKISQAVFDRSGYAYHGRIKALAEGLREGGLKL